VQLVDNTPANKSLKLGDPNKSGFFGPHIISTGVVNLYEGVTVSFCLHPFHSLVNLP
jgi:hypothetical protein